jgi:LPS sulfotransferase NodH
MLSAADLAWDVYFSKYGIVHHKIIYEDFFADTEHGLNQLVDYLGGVPEGFREGRVLSIAPLQVQRDAESLEMRERFIADLERVGGRAFEAEQGEPLKRWNRYFFERGWRG